MQFFKYGLINKEGREIVLAQYACLEESPIPGIYYYGKTSGSISNCTGYGLLDSMGKEITPPVYSSFTRLNDTTFLCKEAERYASQYLLLTTKGKNLLSLNHRNQYFRIVGADTLLVLYSETSGTTATTVYNIHKGLLKENAFKGVKFYSKQKLLLIEDWEYTSGTLMTTSGKIIFDKIQTTIPYPAGTSLDKASLLLVKKSGEGDFRLYNLNTGKFIGTNLQFVKDKRLGYYYNRYSDGLMAAGQKDKWGFIDSTGVFKIIPVYESVDDFSEGWAVVEKKEKGENGNSYMVYINKAGKEMPGIRADYLNASNFKEGLAFYQKTGFSETVRYIDKAGKEVFKSESEQFFDHGKFSNGLAAVPNKEGKYGYINTKGELVIPYQFSIPKTQFSTVNSIAFNQNGFATVALNGKTITINKTGK